MEEGGVMVEEPIYPQNEVAAMAEFVKATNAGSRPSRTPGMPEPMPEPFPDEPPMIDDRMTAAEAVAHTMPLSIKGIVLFEREPTGYILMTDGTRYNLNDGIRAEIAAVALRGMQAAVQDKILEIAAQHGVKVVQGPPEASQNGSTTSLETQAPPEVRRRGRRPKQRPGVS
jgi:hypothetical protein